MNKLQHLVILFLVFFFYKETSGQTEMWVKLSPEIRMNIDKTPFEFRWRPIDALYLPQKYIPTGHSIRTDLMLGVNFYKFKLFSYSKFGEKDQIYSGARLDYNFDLFNKKLLINIQERFFWGLNNKTADHYYLVQYIRYKFNDIITAGLLSYGKWKAEQDFDTGNWFMGPSVDFKLPNNFNFLFGISKDIFHESIYMTFARVGYKFKVNK